MRKWWRIYGFGSLSHPLGEVMCIHVAGGFLLPLIRLLDGGYGGGEQEHVRAMHGLGFGPIAHPLGGGVLLFGL